MSVKLDKNGSLGSNPLGRGDGRNICRIPRRNSGGNPQKVSVPNSKTNPSNAVGQRQVKGNRFFSPALPFSPARARMVAMAPPINYTSFNMIPSEFLGTENGRVVLKRDIWVNGVPCGRDWYTDREFNQDGGDECEAIKIGYGNITFHPNGKLSGCTLSRDWEVGGKRYLKYHFLSFPNDQSTLSNIVQFPKGYTNILVQGAILSEVCYKGNVCTQRYVGKVRRRYGETPQRGERYWYNPSGGGGMFQYRLDLRRTNPFEMLSFNPSTTNSQFLRSPKLDGIYVGAVCFHPNGNIADVQSGKADESIETLPLNDFVRQPFPSSIVNFQFFQATFYPNGFPKTLKVKDLSSVQGVSGTPSKVGHPISARGVPNVEFGPSGVVKSICFDDSRSSYYKGIEIITDDWCFGFHSTGIAKRIILKNDTNFLGISLKSMDGIELKADGSLLRFFAKIPARGNIAESYVSATRKIHGILCSLRNLKFSSKNIFDEGNGVVEATLVEDRKFNDFDLKDGDRIKFLGFTDHLDSVVLSSDRSYRGIAMKQGEKIAFSSPHGTPIFKGTRDVNGVPINFDKEAVWHSNGFLRSGVVARKWDVYNVGDIIQFDMLSKVIKGVSIDPKKPNELHPNGRIKSGILTKGYCHSPSLCLRKGEKVQFDSDGDLVLSKDTRIGKIIGKSGYPVGFHANGALWYATLAGNQLIKSGRFAIPCKGNTMAEFHPNAVLAKCELSGPARLGSLRVE